MLRKKKNSVIYKAGRFSHEGTTMLLPDRAIAKSEAGEEQRVIREERRIVMRTNANRLRGGQWRDTW
jgi:hypothetical protein